MTSYTIASDQDNEYGELVGSGFSKYKVTELLRDKLWLCRSCLHRLGGACNDPGNNGN
jgi:beta-glucosidase